jgi:drug/metabolite transporter (DMT)-like permease
MTAVLSPIANVGFSLAAAFAWGGGDFVGGQAAKKRNVFAVVIIADVAGLVLVLALALGRGEAVPESRGMIMAALAGIVGGAGLTAFYRALSFGRVGLNASITAVLAVAIPVLFGVFTQGLPKPAQLAGFVLAGVSIALISLSDLSAGLPRGFGLAILAGMGFGGFLILSKLAGDHGLFWILTVIRLASLGLVLVIFWASEKRWMPSMSGWHVAVTAGILDVLGNFFYVLATRTGRLDVSAVLSSLYPAVTIALAIVFLHERMNLPQKLGIAGALAATVLLAL